MSEIKDNKSKVVIAEDGVPVKLMTTKELAESLGVEYVKVSGLVATLVKQGAIKKVGTRPAEGGRGKPSDVFEFPSVIELVFWQEQEEEIINPENPEVPEAPEVPESIEVVS